MIKTVTDRKLLIVEDNDALRSQAESYFSERDNRVVAVSTVADARRAIAGVQFDAIILDIMLPDGKGLEIFEIDGLPPVIILTFLSDEDDMLEGFSSGACDYIVAPCSMELLEARLALRLLPSHSAELVINGIILNAVARKALYDGQEIALTGTEFKILKFLMENSGKFFTSEKIYEHVWHVPGYKTNAVRYHVSHLRQKIFSATGQNLIVAEYGKGYSFIKDSAQ